MKERRKKRKLWPVIVQDASTQDVLMLAYADGEALMRSRKSRQAWFYSRSRRRLWKKGETSGNVMAIRRIRWDCDRDALLYEVQPAGPACHTGAPTCFGPGRFGLPTLERIIASRRNAYGKSYTRALLEDPALLAGKIREEAEELVRARTQKQVAWEAADVLYFTLVRMARSGVTLADVIRELEKRHQRKDAGRRS